MPKLALVAEFGVKPAKAPHLASARGSYEDMTTSKRVTRCEPA